MTFQLEIQQFYSNNKQLSFQEICLQASLLIARDYIEEIQYTHSVHFWIMQLKKFQKNKNTHKQFLTDYILQMFLVMLDSQVSHSILQQIFDKGVFRVLMEILRRNLEVILHSENPLIFTHKYQVKKKAKHSNAQHF